MNRMRQTVCALAVAAALFGEAGSGAAQDSVSGLKPTAGQVLSRMLESNRERLAALAHYTSVRTYTLKYTGTGGDHHAEMKVRAEYTDPHRKRFTVLSRSGSKFLCDSVLRKLVEGEREGSGGGNKMQTTLSPENYNAELDGEKTIDPGNGSGREPVWVLRVSPRMPDRFTYKGTVWMSELDYGIVQILAEPAKSPSWMMGRLPL